MRKAHNCGIEAGELEMLSSGLLSFCKLARGILFYGASNLEIQPASGGSSSDLGVSN